MKRVFCALLVTFVCIGICAGCGSRADLSDKAYQCGVSAVDVADAYLDYKITADEAREKFEGLEFDVGRISEEERDISDRLMQARISGLVVDAMIDNPAGMKETRNEIAEMVGLGKR